MRFFGQETTPFFIIKNLVRHMTHPATLHILLVEDDRLLALDLRESLAEAGYPNVTVFHAAAEAILYLGENPLPDVALLDIDLGEGKRNGFDVANVLNRLGKVPIVFWTGNAAEFRQHATMPHSLFAEKISSPESLAHNIGRLAQQFDNQRLASKKTVFLPYQYERHELVAKVRTEDIIFIEADHGRTDFYTLHRPFKGINRSLSEFEVPGQFPSFFRIHHSLVLNVDSPAVKGFNGTFVLVEIPLRKQRTDGSEAQSFQTRKLTVGRRRQAEFRAFWNNRH